MNDNKDYQTGLQLVDEDPIEAMEYFKRASDAGCREASFEIGIMILENAIDIADFDGADYPLGTNEGYEYLVKALKQGCDKAKKTMRSYFDNEIYEPGTKNFIQKLIET